MKMNQLVESAIERYNKRNENVKKIQGGLQVLLNNFDFTGVTDIIPYDDKLVIKTDKIESSNFILDNNKCNLDMNYEKDLYSEILNSKYNKNIDSYTSFKESFNKEFKSPF